MAYLGLFGFIFNWIVRQKAGQGSNLGANWFTEAYGFVGVSLIHQLLDCVMLADWLQVRQGSETAD